MVELTATISLRARHLEMNVFDMKRVIRCCVQLLHETLLISRLLDRSVLYFTLRYFTLLRYSCKVPGTSVRFEQILNFFAKV